MEYKITDKEQFKIVHMSGDVKNDDEAESLINEISRLVREGHKDFCFNLENTTYMNSSGISIFIHALAETEQENGALYMVVSDKDVRGVIELTGINKLIRTYKNMAEFDKENFS